MNAQRLKLHINLVPLQVLV